MGNKNKHAKQAPKEQKSEAFKMETEKDLSNQQIHKADDFNGAKSYGKGISLERWKEAQAAERSIHDRDTQNNPEHYAWIYEQYFRYVGLGKNLEGLHIVEIGPADNPALAICSNYEKSIVVEPMPSAKLEEFLKSRGSLILLINSPLEHIDDLSIDNMRFDMPYTKEVWLFNVMQHIIDPDVFVQKCKLLADRIRFFEPINYPTDVHHPHTYTIEDFNNWFGIEVTKFYQGGSLPYFHTADCAYGVWIK